MAELFLARAEGAEGFERLLVIKRLLPHLAADAHFNSMFIDEAKLTARLIHPKIAQTFELGRHDDLLYIAMEFVDGIDVLGLLRECAHKRKRLRPEIVVHIMSEILDALDFAHSQVDDEGVNLGIVHRDISPSNILLSRRGTVKLVDFGIARAAEQEHNTKAGTLKGKYGYMAPEQVMGKPLDARSDIFSVGIVMTEMLMGRRLFAAPNELDVLLMVRDANLDRLDRLGTHIDAKLDKIVRRALRKPLAERYLTAAELRDELDEWLFDNRLRVSHRDIAALVDSLYDDAWDRKRQALAVAAEVVATADTALAPAEIDGIPSGQLNVGDSLPITVESLDQAIDAKAGAPAVGIAKLDLTPGSKAPPRPTPPPPTPAAEIADLDLGLDLELPTTLPSAGADAGADVDADLDFAIDLGDIDTSDSVPVTQTPVEAAPQAPAVDVLDSLDQAFADLELDAPTAPPSPRLDDDLAFDLDLGDGDAEPVAEVARPSAAAAARPSTAATARPSTAAAKPSAAEAMIAGLDLEEEADDGVAPGDIGRALDLQLAQMMGSAPAAAGATPLELDLDLDLDEIAPHDSAGAEPVNLADDPSVPKAITSAEKSYRYPSIADAVAAVSLQEPDPAALDFDDSEVSTPKRLRTRAGNIRIPTADEIADNPPPPPPAFDDIDATPDDQGQLSDTPAIQLLYQLTIRSATGLLAVAVGGIRKDIYFCDGAPVFVRSNVSTELFGTYLVSQGVISDGELAMALAMMPHYGGKLGDTLVGLGLVKPLEVFRLLARQVRDKLVEFCTWSKGTFSWYADLENPSDAFPLDLNCREVIGAGALALPDRAVVSWGNLVRDKKPRRKPNPHARVDDFGVGAELTKLHGELDGKRNVATLNSSRPHLVDRLQLLRLLFLLVHVDLATCD